MTVAEGVASIP